MSSKTTVSTKNSKNEILDAYNALLQEVQSISDENREQKQSRQKQAEVVKEARDTSQSDIIHRIADLKVNTAKSLDELSSQLITERDKLNTLQKAITIESTKLEEMHNIMANADSLEALILAQRRSKEEFEKEITAKQLSFDKERAEQLELWRKEKIEYEATKKEQELAAKKDKERAEEEYAYKFKLTQQKDTDNYEVKKSMLERELVELKHSAEKELSAREAAIYAQEKELLELRNASQNFDTTLHSKLEETKASITSELDKKHQYEQTLKAKETDSQISLLRQTIASLEDKIKEKQISINEITKQAQIAQSQAQELAKKIVEGVSMSKNLSNVSDPKSS